MTDDSSQISSREAQLKINNENSGVESVILFEVSKQERLSLMNVYI